MGTYCQLYVADYPVLPSKSQASPIVMTLFRERDKKVYERKCAERNRIEWSHTDLDSNEIERVVEYTASVREIRDRLEIMGFTLSRTMAEFKAGKAEYIDYLSLANEDSTLWDEEIALLERSTFSDFLEAFREIVTSEIHPDHLSKRKPDASKLAVYILKDHDELHWGFPCQDIRSFFRALLEVVPESASVTQDLTDLVEGEYYDEDDDVCEMSLDELKGDYSVNSRIILLTEGATDSEVLRASIELLYPHLLDYYSFMDLAVRARGGADSLVHVVKSFAGAGIENRTIALFDNDAAGHSAASVLRHVQLPPNILLMNYPNIALADSYPTQGPNGKLIQSINGSACSIELYFGRDVLNVNGSLITVQWKAYDERVKRYQGEIQQKDLLKDRFFQKVETAQRSRLRSPPGDWQDMRQLLVSVFQAFHA